MVSIFYKTYKADFEWLYYSLLSLRKFAIGYKEIVIVFPESDFQAFAKVDNYYALLSELECKIILVKEYGSGYLYQQFIKMSAHKYCKYEFILFMDSDCVFRTPIDLTRYINSLNLQPIILFESYETVGDAICWKEPTERFLNREVPFEFMRQLPLIYKRSTLEAISKEYPNLESYIMNSERFSEFNAIGAWAYYKEQYEYNFINVLHRKFANQYHSYSGIDTAINEIKSILEI